MTEPVELRCERHLHAKFDPEREVLAIRCQQCTRDQGRPVFHRWPLQDIIDRYLRGELNGACQPQEPRFVHWIVTGA